jgi:NhaP-type Na+/H+ or K+/H+ antiporter
VTTNQVLFGLALTVVLAVGSQVLARSLRIPALIVLLPVGFAAGAMTDDINPDHLLGAAFQPLVSLAVALILFDAGVGSDLRKLGGHTRRTVIRLVTIGVAMTWGVAAFLAAPLLGMSRPAALMLGAILVVSGPTVVGPLLEFVRPVERVQRILGWEGSLIDPIGGILGALVFNAIVAGTHEGVGSQVAQFFLSIGVGVAGGVVGTGLLWLLDRKLRLQGPLSATAMLAAVIGVAAACDIVRDDTGLIAAIFMGLAVAKLRDYNVPVRRPFAETLIQLILGLLFISISATVTPASLRHLIVPALVLVAILILIARPLVAAVCTLRTDLTRGERGFIGWMAPRGIVAAATASTFGASLAADGIGGAAEILPATFLVIVATVTVYALTAAPVARLLGVTRPARTRPLLVGNDPWVVDLAIALQSAGLDVLMWTAPEDQRERITQAGVELAAQDLLATATAQGVQLEDITALLLLTAEDDFNALAATLLAAGGIDGPIYRIAPPPGTHGVVHSFTHGEVLFDTGLSRDAIRRRYRQGAKILTRRGDGSPSPDHDLLFRIRTDGQLVPVLNGRTPTAETTDIAILLGPGQLDSPPPPVVPLERAPGP